MAHGVDHIGRKLNDLRRKVTDKTTPEELATDIFDIYFEYGLTR